MRKILLLMAVLLPVSLFGMHDEDGKAIMKIPLELETEQKLNRSQLLIDIECNYDGMTNTIVTNIQDDLGYVFVVITNYSTGEVWYDNFDCAIQQQVTTQISGTFGIYEVVYMTASGDTYRGLFEIK